MINYYLNAGIIMQTFLASLMAFFITALGAAIVFIFKRVNENILDGMLGLSAGVMIAASFFSLLNPAIEGASNLGLNPWLIVSLGFLFGGLFLILSDIFFAKVLVNKKNSHSLRRSIMLILSITLHNIPEGLAIGVAYGSIAKGLPNASLMGAFMLTVGIAIQNFPEGCAISLPLRRENFSRTKSFVLGALSGLVEPLAAIIGCVLVLFIQNILPFSLAFAAGAMIYVAVSELIPESQKNSHANLMSLWTILGFTIMMVLDIALG